MKPIWRGTLSFGLVTIPVELYSAVAQHSVGFHMLHSVCHTPIEYKRWCPHCKKDISWNEVVKGIPIHDGAYTILTQEEIKKLKPRTTESITVIGFIKEDQIKTIYYNQHYYLLPKKQTDKAYFLIMKSLIDLNKIAVGTFAMHDKDHVAVIKPYENGLLLTTLNYEYEIRMPEKLKTLKVPALDKRELHLAEQLVASFSLKKFNISQFKDTFIKNLKEELKKPRPKKTVKKKQKKSHETLAHLLKASLPHARAHS